MNGIRAGSKAFAICSIVFVIAASCQDQNNVAKIAASKVGTAQSPSATPIFAGAGKDMVTCGRKGLSRDSAVAGGLIPSTATLWNTWIIPEYQDEQRFYDHREGEYGPLTCVVAAPNLNSVPATDYAKPEGVLVAVVYVWKPTPDAPMNSSYSDLKLHVEYNCVVMRKDDQGGWEAYITQSVDSACQPISPENRIANVAVWTPPTAPATPTPLPNAVPAKNPSQNTATAVMVIPPVTRFMVKNNFKVGIGVRCLTDWCTIGATQGDVRQAAHPDPQPNSVGYSRRKVPGWFDDQDIAVSDASAPTKLRPKHWASVIPDPYLESYNFVDDFDARPTHVATIHFKGKPTGKYLTHWQFIATPVADREYEVSIKRTAVSPEQWEVRVNNQLRPKLRVVHQDHSMFGLHIYGTARWAWHDNDEGIWVRCEEGCCQVVADPGS